MGDKKLHRVLYALAMIARAKIPVAEGLKMLADQERGRFGQALRKAYQELLTGAPIAVAMTGLVHDPFLQLLVTTGEKTNQLDLALSQGARVVMLQLDLRQRLWQNLIYPGVVVVCSLIAGGVIWTTLGAEVQHGLALKDIGLGVLIMVATGVFLLWWRRRQMPLHQRCYIWFCLHMMVAQKIPIVQGLELLAQQLRHPTLNQIVTNLQAGRSLTESFACTGHFDANVAVLLRGAEKTGALDQAFEYLYTLDQQAFESRLKMIERLAGPVVIILVGLGLVALVATFLLPLYTSLERLY